MGSLRSSLRIGDELSLVGAVEPASHLSGPDLARDEGQGVPSELLPSLFSRFAADSQSTGVGLGLYIASEIVKLHGGEIAVDSAPDEGAHFHVAVPLEAPSPEAAS